MAKELRRRESPWSYHSPAGYVATGGRPERGYSSSARQTVVAVQALQMGRASSMVPSGSG